MKRGFTLIELMVVIAIITVLAALTFPVFKRVKQSASETETRADLRQAWLALALYEQNDGDWPTTLDAARLATRNVRACQNGNPWDPQGHPMPEPALGQFGYARLVGAYRARADWETALPPDRRPLLASIRYGDPMPIPFEGEVPPDPQLDIGQGTTVRFAYAAPNRVLFVSDAGSVHTVDRTITRIHANGVTESLILEWPFLFTWLNPR